MSSSNPDAPGADGEFTNPFRGPHAAPLPVPAGTATQRTNRGEHGFNHGPAFNQTLSQVVSPQEPSPTPDTDPPETQGPPDPAGATPGTLPQSPLEAGDAARLSGSPHSLGPLPEIPGYLLVGELGRGGMGIVYEARHLRLNRTVALKMVRGAGTPDARAIARFRVEAEAMAAIRHPHVVQVFESGECDQCPFLVLEYLPGGSLSDRLTDGRRLPPPAAAQLLSQVARGTAAAHAASIVHRDLKPGNILFDADGLPKVTDFGLAKRAASDLTDTQAVMGTPVYMAPEQADGRTKFVGPPADVWSLGVILYECLVGVRPFGGPDAREILAKILTSDPAPIPRSLRDLPAELRLICRKALEKEPADRYPTAEELADDLERFLAGRPISVRPLGLASRAARWTRRNPAVASLAAFAAVTLLVVPPAALLYQSRLTAAEELAAARKLTEVAARRAEWEAQQAAATTDYFNRLARVQQKSVEPEPGWTWTALQDLAKASSYRYLPARDPVELRSAVATCLAAPDLRKVAVAGVGTTPGVIAFRPDGKLLAIAELRAWIGCQVLLVDPATGRTLRTLTYPGVPILGEGPGAAKDGGRAIGFSPDGRYLVVGSRSGQIRCWDLSQDPPLALGWKGHKREVTGVDFDPESQFLYTCSTDGTLKQWTIDGGKSTHALLGTIAGPAIAGLKVVAGAPPRVRFVRHGIEAATVDALAPLPDEQIPTAGPLAVTASGHLMLTSGRTGVGLSDRDLCRTGRDFADPDLDGVAHRSVATTTISPDGSLVASCGREDGLRLWDVGSGRIASRQYLGEAYGVAFSADSSRLAVGTEQGTVIYEVRRVPEFATFTQAVPVRAIGVRPDGRVVTVASPDVADPNGRPANLFLDWPLDGKPPGALWKHTSYGSSSVYRVSAFPGGLVTTDGNAGLDWERDGAFKAPGMGIGADRNSGYSFHADGAGKRLWFAFRDKVQVLDLLSRKPLAELTLSLLEASNGTASLDHVAAGNRLAVVGSGDGSVKLLRFVEDGTTPRIETVEVWPGANGRISANALSQDESLVASGTHLGRVTVRDVPSGRAVAELNAHADRVESLAFNAGAGLLATGGRDKRVRLWRRVPAGYELLLTLAPVGATAVKQVAFAPDGRLLVLYDRESAFRCWDVARLRSRLAEMDLGW